MATPETTPRPASSFSGKLVIIGIILVALWAAATSWYFRYHATHQAAKFWGAEAAALIRDAPEVTLYKEPMASTDSLRSDPAGIQAAMQAHIAKSAIDISHAHGLLHLRNALLEDANFIWPSPDEQPILPADDLGYWWLKFRDPKSGKETVIWFSEDCRQGKQHRQRPDGTWDATVFSAAPMANGLREMFAEFSGGSTSGKPGPAAEGPPGPVAPDPTVH